MTAARRTEPSQGSRILNAFVAQRQADRTRSIVQVRKYDAAKQDHTTFGWTSHSPSANEDIKHALRIVRARSRDLAANNDYMRKFLRMCEINIVGPHGFRYKNLSAEPPLRVGDSARPDEAARSLVEDHFKRFGKPGVCDVTGRHSLTQICKIAVKACARDGEYLLREVRGAAAGNAYGYALQALDVDRLDVDNNGTYGNNRVIMSVEVNEVGRAVAFHLLTTHPGDNTYSNRNGQRYERVPASSIIFGGIGDRPEQVRFMPWGHTAMLRLEMLGKFQTAALVAARKGAETVGVLERDAGADELPPGQAPLGQVESDGNAYETSLPGSWETLPTGYTMKPYESNYPSEVFGQFVKDALRGVASGLMVAYNGLANDLEGVNFSSIRAGVLEERDGWVDLQQYFIDQIMERVHAGWLEMALLNGAITYPGVGTALPATKLDKFMAHDFKGRRWSWVDPEKDAKAAEIARQRGWTTDSQITAERGGDWWDNMAEIALEEAEATRLDVTLGKPMPDAQAPAAANGGAGVQGAAGAA